MHYLFCFNVKRKNPKQFFFLITFFTLKCSIFWTDKRRYRESYVSGDPRESSSTPGTYRVNKSPRATKTPIGNRFSVVSDASSNTTSGIASDKMTVSFEENEGGWFKGFMLTTISYLVLLKLNIFLCDPSQCFWRNLWRKKMWRHLTFITKNKIKTEWKSSFT